MEIDLEADRSTEVSQDLELEDSSFSPNFPKIEVLDDEVLEINTEDPTVDESETSFNGQGMS